MSMAYDAIVIGGGHNGLSAAATLASRGKKVCVLEKSDVLGGMAQAGVIADGVPVPRLAHLIYNLTPELVKELGLSQRIELRKVRTVSLSPDGDHVLLDGEDARLCGGGPHPEAAAFADLYKDLKQFSALLAPMAARTPPGAPNARKLDQMAGLLAAAGTGLKLKRMGRRNMREFLRILLSNIYDYSLDELSDGPLAGVLAADAVKGSWSGPRSPGTVLSLMYRFGAGGDMFVPVGGMGRLSDVMAESARAQGAEIRTGCDVAQVLVEDDKAVGVRLEDGSELRAKTVLSSLGARQAMMLAGVEHFDAETTRRLRNLRTKGTTAKVNLVLSKVPEFNGLGRDLMGERLIIAPSATYVERAFNPAKYGEISAEPVLEVVLPDFQDPSLASGSGTVMSIVVHYAPYNLEGGWDQSARTRLLDATLSTLETYAPDIGSSVVTSDVLSPADIEALTGAPGGHWHHGEWSTDQILTVRPVAGLAHYRLGISGYYLCGASAHPGGDITGLPGRNAALQSIRDGAL